MLGVSVYNRGVQEDINMSKVLAVNCGSSSLKFQLFEMDTESVITSGIIERIGMEDSIFTIKYNGTKDKQVFAVPTHQEAVQVLLDTINAKKIVERLDELKGIGHRDEQGGPYFDSSCVVDDDVIAKIDELSPLAPLHNPAHIIGIKAFKEAIPTAGAVVVFDTAFHHSIKPENAVYPIPYKFYEENKIRKYGAHGTSHYYVSKRTQELLGNPEHANIIVCHLGAGASLCAVKDGKSIDTSMGLTPLAGVMMATRSGDIDASVVDHLIENLGYDMKTVFKMLNKESGLLGVSGVSGDMRDIIDAKDAGNQRAELAFNMFRKRVADYIGSYFVELGHVDAISFTAGIGENSFIAREAIIDLIKEALGIVLDDKANVEGHGERLISAPESKIKVFVVPTDEELVIARDTKELLNL